MGIFVNRTLNMKQISAIGLDMDYTLVRYDSHAFEQMTYEEIKKKLIADYKYPSEIKKLKFEFNRAIRGLVIDKPHGNILKLLVPSLFLKNWISLNYKDSIFIKDCDDYFYIDHIEPNQVCTYSLNDCKNITPGNKSYIKMNEHGEILTIVEKNVISSDFCCGLYSFNNSQDFLDTYRSITHEGEIYISHIIFQMLLNGHTFYNHSVKDYIDWGTQEDWDKFLTKL
jgi:hypothetical protein